MVRTFFEIEGKMFKLKYQRVNTSEGILYQGIIFIQKAIGFSYIVRTDNTVVFDNDFIDKGIRNIIIDVIEKKERKINRK